jgi:hypothetical protein
MNEFIKSSGVQLIISLVQLFVMVTPTLKADNLVEPNPQALQNSITLRRYYDPYIPVLRYNLDETSNHVILNSYIESLGCEPRASWTVNTIEAAVYTSLVRYNFGFSRGVLDTSSGSDLSPRCAYRFSLGLKQQYINKSFLYYYLAGSTGKYFPIIWSYMGYEKAFGKDLCFSAELHQMIFGKDQIALILPVSIQKKFSIHELSVKPFFVYSDIAKVGFRVSERFWLHKQFAKSERTNQNSKVGYIIVELGCGYFPDPNLFIAFDNNILKRSKISVDGVFNIKRDKIQVLSSVGFDFNRLASGILERNYIVGLGLRVLL